MGIFVGKDSRVVVQGIAGGISWVAALSLIAASGMLRPVKAAEAEAETDEGREAPAEAAETQSEEASVPNRLSGHLSWYS